jgi:hypothetical protein
MGSSRLRQVADRDISRLLTEVRSCGNDGSAVAERYRHVQSTVLAP